MRSRMCGTVRGNAPCIHRDELTEKRPKARGSLPIHTIHQTGAVRIINFEFRQRTDGSAVLGKGFFPVSARSDLLPESGRRFRSDEVLLRPQDSDTVPGNVFFISRGGGAHPTSTIHPARQAKSDSIAAGHGTTCRRVVLAETRLRRNARTIENRPLRAGDTHADGCPVTRPDGSGKKGGEPFSRLPSLRRLSPYSYRIRSSDRTSFSSRTMPLSASSTATMATTGRNAAGDSLSIDTASGSEQR